jgi:hypothetical protein
MFVISFLQKQQAGRMRSMEVRICGLSNETPLVEIIEVKSTYEPRNVLHNSRLPSKPVITSRPPTAVSLETYITKET